MSRLDDPKIAELDESGMLAHAEAVGTEFWTAWARTQSYATGPTPRNVVVCGVGGSATAGDYLTAICYPVAPVPVRVIRGYSLPNFVGPGSLAIICSYSGGTEEALACYEDARGRGAEVFTVTGGGELEERSERDCSPMARVTYRAMPRAAIAHSLAPLLRAAVSRGLSDADDLAVGEAARAHATLVRDELGMPVASSANGAKRLATDVAGRLPIIMAAEHLAPAALRFKNQLSENAKMLAAAETLPEANHNFIVGLEGAARWSDVISLVTLESDLYAPRTRRRFEVTAAQFRESGIPVQVIPVAGKTILAQLLAATAWGDFTSIYLALLEGIDPTPVPHIEALKAAMGEPLAL